MHNATHSTLLDSVRDVVLRAGEIILQHWDQPKDIAYKGRVDLVTETDVAVESFLTRELSALLPQASFLAEESAAENELERLTWIVDPLDGTTNFAHGLFAVATSVALWQDGKVELGVVNLPKTGECFFAQRGCGAWLNGSPISVSAQSHIEQALVATGFPYAKRERIDEIVPRLRGVLSTCRGMRRMGAAAVDLAYTACGRFDAFYELGLKPWDTAAGWLLVQEAGGRVSRFSPVADYALGADAILATNSKLHMAMAELLAI
ncbi:inositol monophosphatase family protein [Desulfovermiculus halophilus]|jgi:myo-inositol-1(or 4)-monophosphatase|uniref:inositol monophosphatase family protein n=1 Tax=Desulfovermiculus halophilus TaxID=339722 RepID=UPI0004805DF7|nr:inositol monophosphatase family protein [Desulfovermiculus halophilus]